MAASVMAAVKERVTAFTFAAPVPKVFFDEAPFRVAGVAVAPPYVIIKDDGTTPEYEFELKAIETTRFRLEVFALSMTSLDAIVAVIRYNGGAMNAGLGMDFAAALPVTGQTLQEVVREREQRFQEADRYVADALVFRCTMTYRAVMLRTA